MAAEQTAEKEKRSARISVAVTPTEREALELIARVRKDLYDEEPSTVLRDYSLADAVAYAAEIKNAIGGALAAAS